MGSIIAKVLRMQISVVVIDDDEDDLFLLCEAISYVDGTIECLKFIDPSHAIDELFTRLNRAPDYIFLDYNMPGVKGDIYLDLFRKEKKFDNSIIVMLTSSMFPFHKSQFLAAGANYAFEKPRRMEDYYDFLRNLFQER